MSSFPDAEEKLWNVESLHICYRVRSESSKAHVLGKAQKSALSIQWGSLDARAHYLTPGPARNDGKGLSEVSSEHEELSSEGPVSLHHVVKGVIDSFNAVSMAHDDLVPYDEIDLLQCTACVGVYGEGQMLSALKGLGILKTE